VIIAGRCVVTTVTVIFVLTTERAVVTGRCKT
jgi:hypothetical protein